VSAHAAPCIDSRRSSTASGSSRLRKRSGRAGCNHGDDENRTDSMHLLNSIVTGESARPMNQSWWPVLVPAAVTALKSWLAVQVRTNRKLG
jgi:hypothetical protein